MTRLNCYKLALIWFWNLSIIWIKRSLSEWQKLAWKLTMYTIYTTVTKFAFIRMTQLSLYKMTSIWFQRLSTIWIKRGKAWWVIACFENNYIFIDFEDLKKLRKTTLADDRPTFKIFFKRNEIVTACSSLKPGKNIF